jgi:glycogen synthase
MYIYTVRPKRPPKYTARDAQFTIKVDAWQQLSRGFLAAFGRPGLDSLNARERVFNPDSRKIAFLTFENSFAPLGGLAAVVRILPVSLNRAGEDVTVLTPLYANIPKVRDAIENGTIEPVVTKQEFRISSYTGTAGCYRHAGAPVPTYFIAVDGRFTAALNPYSYSDSNEILDDSLAFCAAAPFILNKLGINRDILFHAHDWETAPIAITSKFAALDGLLESARTVLTLHNSFDSGIDVDRKRKFFGDKISGDTVLKCVLPLLNGPLTTVSTPFADELRADPLQRTIFTNHLQSEFSANPPIGVENGMFGKPHLLYTYTALSHARQGVYDKMLAEKRRFREATLRTVGVMAERDGVIGGLTDAAVTDTGTDINTGINANADKNIGTNVNTGINTDTGTDIDIKTRPIFFMSGRLDLMQKGFDVIFHAVRCFPAGKAALIFCPSSADGARRSKELAFFREIAEERPGDIVIWPFRITEEDYVSAVLGSSFLLMPSFYEPFGAATEGFIYGTPVVARATGGLTVQVRPLQGGGSGSVGAATGLLYREAVEDDARACAGWRDTLSVPVDKRISVPLYRSMVKEAFGALSVAADIFADRVRYGRMMVNCMDSLRDFSWNAAVSKYRRVYEAAARRGFFDE